MYRACIAVVDASRARLFTYERSTEVEGTKEELVEKNDLVNPSRRRRPSDLFSDSRPGTNRTGNLQYTFDDHRDAHIEAIDAAFARHVADELHTLAQSSHTKHVILCASPHMLGELREATRDFRDLEIDELARDLVKLTPAALREHLGSYDLLPALTAR